MDVTRDQRPEWLRGLKRFEHADTRRAVWQLVNTLLPYLGLLALIYLLLRWGLPQWATLILSLPAGALLLRLFVIFHDCAHGSLFPARRANAIVGGLLGFLTFTSFSDWRHSHGVHHSHSGNLDRRGIGDIWTMTVAEYLASGVAKRLAYRFARNPVVLFLLGPIGVFLIANRFPGRGAQRRQVLGVVITDVLIAAVVALCSATIGIGTYLLVQLPAVYLMGVGAVWIFYIHHQFDPSYWARTAEWESLEAALRGSSYYRLPRLLQWISANIGLHHIHHLAPRIPNYHLQRSLRETPQLELDDPLTLAKSIAAVRLNLWDEERAVLVSFRELKVLSSGFRTTPGKPGGGTPSTTNSAPRGPGVAAP